MVLMFVQLAIVLLALYVGSRYGSLALGAISGIGLAILVFGFGMEPGTPPTDVIYIIIAAIACASVFQASGGMDFLIQVAERLLRKHPDHITILAPFCTFFLTVLVGTGHVVYTLMPIIADISLRKGIRPERPCAVSSVASQVGITCSPIAAAVVSFVTISNANGFDITIPQVLMVTFPASCLGVLAAALCSYRRGKDLDKDPDFQARLQDPETYKYMYGESASVLGNEISAGARRSVVIFFAAILAIVLLAAFGFKRVKMSIVIQIVMLAAAALMIIFCKTNLKKATTGSVWRGGMVAVVSIYGIAWLADTFFSNYMDVMRTSIGGIAGTYPWAICLVFFLVSILINSQGAVVVAMLPLAYSLGIPGPVLLGALPCVYGYFFIPNYPSDIATVNMDRSGTTRIGKYLLNHSFMMPGLVSIAVSTVFAMILSSIIY